MSRRVVAPSPILNPSMHMSSSSPRESVNRFVDLSSTDSPPLRKRQKLSSPSYDSMTENLSQEDLQIVRDIELKYSHSIKDSSVGQADPLSGLLVPYTTDTRAYSDPHPPARSLVVPRLSPTSTTTKELQPRLLTVSTANSSGVSTQLPTGFASARNLSLDFDQGDRPSSSPHAPAEPDYDAWFNSTSIPISIGFQTAMSSFDMPNGGFKTAGNNKVLALSATALEKAAKRMRTWEEEVVQELRTSEAASGTVEEETPNPFLSTNTPRRPVLRPLENSYASPCPSTPTPVGSAFFKAETILAPSSESNAEGKSTAFKPPSTIRTNVQPSSHASSPLNPSRIPPSLRTPIPKHSLPAISTKSISYHATGGPASTPQLPRLGLTAVNRGSVSRSDRKFSTPFKVGMRPGEPGRQRLEEERKFDHSKPRSTGRRYQELTAQRPTCKGKGKNIVSHFNLSPPSNRCSLSTSGLLPQSYTGEDLQTMGINFTELAQITPDLALYYSFHSLSSSPIGPPLTSSTNLGPSAALQELLQLGCSLATRPWVDNHWGLILWKLAGLVCLDPHLECSPSTRRWCWAEIINQLRYRYERELNRGVRPPLRLIAARDSPASSPMILCVSKVTCESRGVVDDGTLISPFPEMEVTDGWYRMRAEVDEPLARAIRRKVIRVGRKIAIVGARLSSSRNDPSEILESYDSVSLRLNGNSSHLAPWHSKLGFQKYFSISTLHSLTPDGGNVTFMNLVITKVYPIAYLESVEGEGGKMHREGPRGEKEENIACEHWKARRDTEEARLRFALEDRFSRFDRYADRMEQKAGPKFQPSEDDYAPDHIGDICDQLENASASESLAVMRSLGHREAGWLARLIREKITKEREQSRNEIESELNSICPPRQVSNFRVIIVQDLQTKRRSANRCAQLTVWNVMNLVFEEGEKPGNFQEGQKFLVTNLVPSQQSAWMAPSDTRVSEIYLSTRRDSRWTLLP